jgi:hypothetical protein
VTDRAVGGRAGSDVVQSLPAVTARVSTAAGPADLQATGVPAQVVDDAIARLRYLNDLWLTEVAGDLVRLSEARGGLVSVAPETLLLLGLAEQLAAGSAHGVSNPRGAASARRVRPTSMVRLNYGELTVDLSAGLPDQVVRDLRSWAPALMVDLIIADLQDGGCWGACLSLGRVVRAIGIDGRGKDWTVAVELSGAPDAQVVLHDAALGRSAEPQHRALPSSADGTTRHRAAGDVVWAAASSDMAWRAQALADLAVGVEETLAHDLLAPCVTLAWLLRGDDVLRVVRGRAGGSSVS